MVGKRKTRVRFPKVQQKAGRVHQALSGVELEGLPPKMHNDGDGLYLNVEKSGSRSWLLRVTIRGKRHWVGLGSLSLVTLDQAREEAAKLRIRASKGEDVLEQRRAERRIRVIPTFEEAAKTVHEKLSETFNSETHAYNWMQSLETYVFPVFGKMTVDKIGSPEVLAAIGPIWNTVPDTAARTLRRIKAVFDWCQVSGHRTLMMNGLSITMPNPCECIRMALPKQKRVENHHEALPYSELPQFIQEMRKANSAVIVKAAFEFLILTAARTSEVLLAEWNEIDLEERVWSIPTERMKMKQAHRVPLSQRAVEILELAKQFNDAEIVFPGRKPGEPLSNMAFLMTMRRMGRETLTAHGFRATFKTWAEETTKFDSLVIEASLAHAVKGIERHYLRTTFFEKRQKLMQAWARFATAAPSAKVVKMR